jgi:long-chain fatty acid transport protein
LSDQTRFGLVYRSELDAELDGDAEFGGLGPITDSILDMAGLLNARVDIDSTQPQAITAGLYHEFENQGAVTFDVAWIDFSSFVLSEIYVNDNQVVANSINYDDIWAVSTGYTWPVNDRLMLGVGVLLVDDMVSDQDRTLTLRLDDIWGVGVGVEWEWKPTRVINATLDYIEMGSAPVSSPGIDGIGAVTGEYSDRKALLFRVGVEFGNGPN